MMKTKTATIERFTYYGTGKKGIRLEYRGHGLKYHKQGTSVYHQTQHLNEKDEQGKDPQIEHFKQIAKNLGFTHVCFKGEWPGDMKPKGGKL